MSHIRYELHCLDTEPAPEYTPACPLGGVTDQQLWAAHNMAHVMLNRSPNGWDSFLYKGGPNRLELPVFTLSHAFVDLSIERLDPKSLLAIAEICQTLHCILRPLDGGPDVTADPHAIAQELTRRAFAALRPQGKSLFEVVDAAARAASEARSQACAEARALREARIKRRKPVGVAGLEDASAQAPH
jgi:hypothetical protein